MPFDVAFSLPAADAQAFGIIFGEFEGNVWDWNTDQWKQQGK